MKVELLEIQGKPFSKHYDGGFEEVLKVFFSLTDDECIAFLRLRCRSVNTITFQYSESNPTYRVNVSITKEEAFREFGTNHSWKVATRLQEMLVQLLRG